MTISICLAQPNLPLVVRQMKFAYSYDSSVLSTNRQGIWLGSKRVTRLSIGHEFDLRCERNSETASIVLLNRGISHVERLPDYWHFSGAIVRGWPILNIWVMNYAA